jgi:hypothetical protein
VPTHPDTAAGLGYLEVVHTHFTPLIFSLSVIQSSSFAEDIVAGKLNVQAIYPGIAFLLFVNAILFLGPLCIVAKKLLNCRIQGLSIYMEFASHYVNSFEKKWISRKMADQESMLGTPDLQSLADLSNSMNIINNMRIVPISPRLLISFLIAALIPILPILLFKYPFADLIGKFLARLSGL